jgi:hypothetical protein
LRGLPTLTPVRDDPDEAPKPPTRIRGDSNRAKMPARRPPCALDVHRLVTG